MNNYLGHKDGTARQPSIAPIIYRHLLYGIVDALRRGWASFTGRPPMGLGVQDAIIMKHFLEFKTAIQSSISNIHRTLGSTQYPYNTSVGRSLHWQSTEGLECPGPNQQRALGFQRLIDEHTNGHTPTQKNQVSTTKIFVGGG